MTPLFKLPPELLTTILLHCVPLESDSKSPIVRLLPVHSVIYHVGLPILYEHVRLSTSGQAIKLARTLRDGTVRNVDVKSLIRAVHAPTGVAETGYGGNPFTSAWGLTESDLILVLAKMAPVLVDAPDPLSSEGSPEEDEGLKYLQVSGFRPPYIHLELLESMRRLRSLVALSLGLTPRFKGINQVLDLIAGGSLRKLRELQIEGLESKQDIITGNLLQIMLRNPGLAMPPLTTLKLVQVFLSSSDLLTFFPSSKVATEQGQVPQTSTLRHLALISVLGPSPRAVSSAIRSVSSSLLTFHFEPRPAHIDVLLEPGLLSGMNRCEEFVLSKCEDISQELCAPILPLDRSSSPRNTLGSSNSFLPPSLDRLEIDMIPLNNPTKPSHQTTADQSSPPGAIESTAEHHLITHISNLQHLPLFRPSPTAARSQRYLKVALGDCHGIWGKHEGMRSAVVELEAMGVRRGVRIEWGEKKVKLNTGRRLGDWLGS